MADKISAASYFFEDPAAYDEAGVITLVADRAAGPAVRVRGVEPDVPLPVIASAGVRRAAGESLTSLHERFGDGGARMADMEADGTVAQVIYPSLAITAYQSPDLSLIRDVTDEANRAAASFCADSKGCLAPVWLSTAASPDVLLTDVQKARSGGYVGVLIPSHPYFADSHVPDYADPAWDSAWSAAATQGVPLTFHARTSREFKLLDGYRPPSQTYGFYNVTRNPQQLVALFTLTRIFERHPDLRVVTVEADSSWMPHFSVRIMHYYNVHGPFLGERNLRRLPEEYIRENVYTTLVDDVAALRMKSDLNIGHTMWTDLMTSPESAWPQSESSLGAVDSMLTADEIDGFLGVNCADLYRLQTSAAAA